MDPSVLAILSVIFLFLLLLLGMPVAFSLALTGIAGLVLLQGPGALNYAVGQFPVSRVMTYSLSVIPLFILMGQIAFAAGVTNDAYDVAYKFLSRLRGGLCMVTIGACGLFAATTGSSAAEVAAMGKIAIPEMKRYGYDTRLATGTVVSAGTVGILIPPSVGLILYGILTYESIGDLFIAGVIPGIVSLLIYMAMVYVRCLYNPKLAPRSVSSAGWKERLISLRNSWGILLIFATIIGGIYTGIATPTEVGALGSLIALVLAAISLWKGKCNWSHLKEAISETVKLNAMIFAFIFGAGIFGLFITATGVLPLLVETVKGLEASPYLVLFCICLVYIPLGMLLDPMSLTIVTVPLVYPIVVSSLGFNGIWFGVIFMKLMEIAVITPPVGINLYVLKAQYPEMELMDIIRGSLWFFVMDIVTLLILVSFPAITLWLPDSMK
jgi:C4-dicarboxylate transporter, DctM subunit